MTVDEQLLWATARKVCTPAELQVLLIRERLQQQGREHGYRSVAEQLGIAWTTVRDRTNRAEQRIRRQLSSS